MKFSLTEKEFQFLEENLIIPLKNVGIKVWLFGSRARGDARPFSDIDIMVELPLGKDSSLLPQIQEFFENSNFPYKLDIVELKNFATSYRNNFEKEKIAL